MPLRATDISIVAESFECFLISSWSWIRNGLTLQTINSSSGLATINTQVTKGGVYLIKVVNLSLGPLEFTTAVTPLVLR